MSTLYQLTEAYQELLSMALDPDTDPEALADTMEAIEGEFGKIEVIRATLVEAQERLDGYEFQGRAQGVQRVAGVHHRPGLQTHEDEQRLRGLLQPADRRGPPYTLSER